MTSKNIKDILFKSLSGVILLVFGVAILNMPHFPYLSYSIPSNIYTCAMIILIPAYYISIIFFISYLNHYRSDKWILLPVWITTLIILFTVLYYVLRFLEDPHYTPLILTVFHFLLLPGNLFTALNFKSNYRHNSMNYTFFGIMIAVMLMVFASPEPELLVFSFPGTFISFLYLLLAKKGYREFIDRDKVYRNLLKAKSLLDQNIINQTDYEIIRSKWVKYL